MRLLRQMIAPSHTSPHMVKICLRQEVQEMISFLVQIPIILVNNQNIIPLVSMRKTVLGIPTVAMQKQVPFKKPFDEFRNFCLYASGTNS